jgi:hypothetical protein
MARSARTRHLAIQAGPEHRLFGKTLLDEMTLATPRWRE